jgi:hypothetical protein
MREQSADSDAQNRVERIAAAIDAAFPDADVDCDLAEPDILQPVDPKDRHVVLTAIAADADAIVTFNVRDFAADHLKEHLHIEVLHPDDFVMDLVDLNEMRAVAAFRERRARKQNPPWDVNELTRRLRNAGLLQTSLWASAAEVATLI